jgi:pimeloyl-[acyl-carrier protein] methyl ester esterase
MKTVALSGWGQPHDALRAIAPDAVHVPYAGAESVEQAFALLAPHRDAQTLIGWSMGGQMAVRAVADGVLKPKLLVLIATPFQFIRNTPAGVGMPPDIFAQYSDNYRRNPERTLNKSYALIAHNDKNADTVWEYLAEARLRIPQADWQRWLEWLSDYSCHSLDFSQFPLTLLLHGSEDVVVSPLQSQAYRDRLPCSELRMLEGCGHAPHWHDSERVRGLIARGGLREAP